MIKMIKLPLLETIDKPFEKDEKLMEKALSKNLTDLISLVKKHPQPDMGFVQINAAGSTWEKIFTKLNRFMRICPEKT